MPRVLIADDTRIIREALKSVFNNSGDGWLVCGEAENGLEAVQLAATLQPDIVLLDFQMPMMNGLDAAKEIAKKFPSLPIAMYTLHQHPIFEKQAFANGVRKVISKSELFAALIPCLQEIVDEAASQ